MPSLFNRILHFGLGGSFRQNFLFNNELNSPNSEVHYFIIGGSGYVHSAQGLAEIFTGYVRAARLLIRWGLNSNSRSIAYVHTTKYALPALLLCRLLNVGEVVYFNHGVPYVAYTGLLRAVLKALEWSNVKVAHRVITVSSELEPFLRLDRKKSSRCATLPGSSSGLQDSRYVSRAAFYQRLESRTKFKAITYLYAGRLEERKGVFLLLDAWKVHIQKFPHDQLVLCGFSSQEFFARKPDAVLKNVSIKGYVAQMTQEYDCADVVILPSFHEGFGYALLEGAARGCAIVCANIPGPGVLFGKWMRSLRIDSGNASSLVELMGKLSSDLQLLKIAKCLSYRSALRFRSDKILFPF